MSAVLLAGGFGVLLAAGGLWAAAPLLADTPNVSDGHRDPESAGAEQHCPGPDGTGTAGFGDYFTIYP